MRAIILGSALLMVVVMVGLSVRFYQGFVDFRSNFLSQLEVGPTFHKAIQSSDNFYPYRANRCDCILVNSSSQGRLYDLYRE